MLVLVVEDNKRLAHSLQKGLQGEDLTADLAYDGEDALTMARTGAYDAIVLDIMLPGRSGFDVIRELRHTGVKTPILCLTARGALEDKVAGLELGADDYLAKPFEFAEVVARIHALMRRSAEMVPQKLRCADLELDPARRRVNRGGQEIDLTAKEYALLEFLLRREGRVVTRASVIRNVWGLNFDGFGNIVEVFINRLRNKVDYPFPKKLIQTIRGIGYCLTEGDAEQ